MRRLTLIVAAAVMAVLIAKPASAQLGDLPLRALTNMTPMATLASCTGTTGYCGCGPGFISSCAPGCCKCVRCSGPTPPVSRRSDRHQPAADAQRHGHRPAPPEPSPQESSTPAIELSCPTGTKIFVLIEKANSAVQVTVDEAAAPGQATKRLSSKDVATSEMPATLELTPVVGGSDVVVSIRGRPALESSKNVQPNLSGYIGCGEWQAQLAADKPNAFLLKRTQASQSSAPGFAPAAPQVPMSAQAAPQVPAANSLAPPDPACVEWTDGCQVCQRQPDNKVACSNTEIACQLKEPRCARR